MTSSIRLAGAKMFSDKTIRLEEETGGVATVTIADVVQLHGVVHVIDRVLLPAQ